jgi:uncharacterized protein (DUF305 family)
MTTFKTSLYVATCLMASLALSACQPAPTNTVAVAGTDSMDHSQMDHSQMDHGNMMGPSDPAAATPSTKAFQAANSTMHQKMAIPYSGDADKDFIPHHEGAVAMARVVLEHGKDPEIRKLAEDIIAAQDREISQMKAWQAKNNTP